MTTTQSTQTLPFIVTVNGVPTGRRAKTLRLAEITMGRMMTMVDPGTVGRIDYVETGGTTRLVMLTECSDLGWKVVG